jgi:hypothetical protein
MKTSGSEVKNTPDPAPTESIQVQTCHKPLRTNPYTSYRDETGRWIVIRQPELQKSC